MTKYLFAHIYGLAALALVAIVLALVFRKRLKRLMKLAKAAASDPRLPKHVRWLFRIGIVAKLWPGPDLGIDEFCFGLGILLLATRHRKVWAEIRADIDAKEQRERAHKLGVHFPGGVGDTCAVCGASAYYWAEAVVAEMFAWDTEQERKHYDQAN